MTTAHLPSPEHVFTINHDKDAPNENARCYLAVGPNCWGRAVTKEQAIKNARKHCPVPRFRKWIVFYCHPSTYIDDMGSLMFYDQYGQPERIQE